MKCVKCGGKIINNCCIRCGLLTNGNIVKQDEEVIDKYHVQRLYNKNFDIMNRNEKTYINFLLGPLYFSYRGHLILGIISVFIDYLLFYFISTFISSASYISLLTNLMLCFYLILNRLIYVGFSNSICLLLDNIKINKIRRKYKDNYLDKLNNTWYKKYYLFITLIFYLIVIILFVIIKRYSNGTL